MPQPIPPTPKTPADALQLILDVAAFIMEYGRVETGTPESAKLLRAYSFLANHHGVEGQAGNIPPSRPPWLR